MKKKRIKNDLSNFANTFQNGNKGSSLAVSDFSETLLFYSAISESLPVFVGFKCFDKISFRFWALSDAESSEQVVGFIK